MMSCECGWFNMVWFKPNASPNLGWRFFYSRSWNNSLVKKRKKGRHI